MAGKFIITKKDHQIVTALYENQKMVELQFHSQEEQKISLGDIYVGRVKNIVKNINGAFLDVGNGNLCYYSFADNQNPMILNAKKQNTVAEGDLLLVQVQKEAMKTKLPSVTSHINVTGKFLVLTYGKCSIGISNKIQSERERTRLKNIARKWKSKDYGWIVRTNAQGCDEELLQQEAKSLIEQYEAWIRIAKFRTEGYKVSGAFPSYLTELRDQNSHSYERIITDYSDLYEEIESYLEEHQKEDKDKLEYYNDTMISLNNLLSMEKDIEDALREKVWLKSGGYLIIQPTEAMVVIDVNTGKSINKKKSQEHFRLINLEAAKEVARQIRLRNLSGIIIVDFIDLDKEEDQLELMETLRQYTSKDRIKTDVIDMTKLNLVEITRKKIRKPIYEQRKGIEICLKEPN